MTCRTCGAGLRQDAKFCSECGSPTSRACPNCAHPVEESDKFCAECGTPLVAPQPASHAEAPPPVPPDDTQERRFVSALFIDIVGFTPLTETRDSEEVRTMLTRYFDRAREIVDRFGGVIDKYIGDAVMAVWGAKVAHEDDAERAVRAALELIDAVEELGRAEGMPGLSARAGVQSGEAAVGGDGNEATGLIIGDSVNIASRLQGAAPPGTVLVGRSTQELAARAIEFEAAGEVELKGKSEPVGTWRAVRVIGGHGGARRAEGLVPPFVGRTDELRLLKDNLHAAERDDRVRLVSIVGQGGIGKSRLTDEFWNYVDGLTDTIYWHHGRSPAYGDGLSFWALGEMVRQRAGIAEGDDDHRSRTRLRTVLTEFVPDADDRAWMEPRLEGLLGLTELPSTDRAELFAAWRMLFLRIARRGPVVLSFEDLHWADDGVLDFIDELVSIGADAPILVVSLARPEILERRPGWGSGRTNSVSVHLAPLAPATMAELVHGVVPDSPASLVDRLVERSGGIPLYAVELLRMLVARDLAELGPDGRLRMVGDVEDIDIPDSLHGLVGSRIDQFDPESRSLIADAAILGQSFTLEGLQALHGGSVDDLTAALEPLGRREVLSVNRDPRSPERGQYRFVQSIIREVAHERVSRADRFDRHLRVAEYFDSLDEPEVAGVVASHYLDALEVAPSKEDEARIRTKAVEALVAAADRADAMRSHAQVVALCRRGIELSDVAADRGELLIRAARAAHAGLDESAEATARQALAAFTDSGDATGVVRAAAVLAKLLDDIGRSNEAWPPLSEALESAPGETADHAVAMAELGRAYMLDQQPETGMEWCDRALGVAERLDLVPTIAEAWITKGAGMGMAYRTREAMVLLEAGMDLARKHQLSTTKRRAMANLSYVGASDRPIGDHQFHAERLEEARRLGHPRLLAEALLAGASDRHSILDFDGYRSFIDEIDPQTLSRELRWTYEEITGYHRMLTGHAAEEVAAAERRWDEQGEADSQTSLGRRLDRAHYEYMLGRPEQAFEISVELDHPAPGCFDMSWALVSALRLDDVSAFSRLLAKLDARPFRGRVIDLIRAGAQAGAAALEGRTAESAALFERSAELADDVWGPLYGSMIKVGAARLLGLDHPVGRRLSHEAHAAWTSAGLVTLLDLHADDLLPSEETPEVESA